jgi:hypothetical protein
METIKKPVFQVALVIALSTMLFCISADGAPQQLRRADLLHWVGCLTQKDALVGFNRFYSGPDGLRARYIYGIRDTVDKRDTDIFLIVYSANSRTASYYEISVDDPETGGELVYRTSGSLKKDGTSWALDDAEGGVATRIWAQKMVHKVSLTSLQVIPLSEIPTPTKSCWWSGLHPKK